MSVNLYNATTDTLKNIAGDIINPKSVNEMIAPIEDGTASKSYAVGEQFIMNDLLCEATQAITQGDTMVIGTNCEESEQLSKQVKDIKSDIGDLSSLTTTDKDSAVDAINELNGKLITSKLVHGDFTGTTDAHGRIELPFKLGLVSLYSVWVVSGGYVPIVRAAATQNTQNNCLAYFRRVDDWSVCPADTELHVYYAYILI